MRKPLFAHIAVPISLTIIIQLLLCLPGTSLPDIGLFGIPHFDKVAHIIIFGSFTASWCYYFYARSFSVLRLKKIFFGIFLTAAANGIIMEFVQLHLIANRSFDEGDIIANILSAGIAYGICNIKLLKINW
jgi:hypothetical protein